MFKTNVFARNMALAGAVTLLLASSAFAQYGGYYPRNEHSADRGFANRIVEGTIASVEPGRFGERIRLTNGMDLIVPNSVIATNQGRRYQTSLLQPGDVVRMTVFSREGDGRDARVRSFELLRSGNGYGNGYGGGYNQRSLTGTVVSFDRRNNVLVLQTDNGRMVNVDVQSYEGRFRRGDRVSVSGRMDRNSGSFIAAGVRVEGYQR
jgi:hypothetical protein